MKRILIIIVIIIVICCAGCNAMPPKATFPGESSGDVFYFNWGMSIEDVVKLEQREADISGLGLYIYNNKDFYGLPCSVTYGFEDNKLTYYACDFNESVATNENFIAVKDYVEKNIKNLSVDQSLELEHADMITWVNDKTKIDLSLIKDLSWTKEEDNTNSLELSAEPIE